MAKITGRNGLIKVAGNTVARLITITIDESLELIDATDLDSTAKEFEAGDDMWTGEMECHWDKADTTGQGAMTIGAQLAIIFQPEGDTSGDLTRTGTAIITSRGTSGIGRNDMVKQSFSLQGIGALVDGSVA